MDNVFNVLSFDFMEFATSPEGILMIIGCIFLIIGIVMLLMGKGKKEKVEEFSKVESTTVDKPAVQSVATPDAPVQSVVNDNLNSNNSVNATTNTNDTTNATNITTNTNNGVFEDSVIAPVPEPINFTNVSTVQPANTQNPVVDVNTNVPNAVPLQEVPLTPQEPVTPVVPETPQNIQPTNVVNEVQMPTPVETPVQQVQEPVPMSASVQTPTPSVTVYGGVDPNATVKTVFEEKPREIYGGANPLENTAPIPSVPVNAAYQNVASGNQVIAPVNGPIPNTEQQVVTPQPMPSVEQVQTPVQMPITQDQNVSNVVTPVVSVPVEPVAPAVPSQGEEIETLEF